MNVEGIYIAIDETDEVSQYVRAIIEGSCVETKYTAEALYKINEYVSKNMESNDGKLYQFDFSNVQQIIYDIEEKLLNINDSGREVLLIRIITHINILIGMPGSIMSDDDVNADISMREAAAIKAYHDTGMTINDNVVFAITLMGTAIDYLYGGILALARDYGVDIQERLGDVLLEEFISAYEDVMPVVNKIDDRLIKNYKPYPKSTRSYILSRLLEEIGVIQDGNKLKCAEFIEAIVGGNPQVKGRNTGAIKVIGAAPTSGAAKLAEEYLNSIEIRRIKELLKKG